MIEWIKIEEAPKDGRWLVCRVDGYLPMVARWYKERWVGTDSEDGKSYYNDYKFYDNDYSYEPNYFCYLPYFDMEDDRDG